MDTGRLFKTIQDQGIPRSYSFCTSHYNSFPLRRTSKIRCFHLRPVTKSEVDPGEEKTYKYIQVIPICSMYGIFTNIYPIDHPNLGKYTIHGAYGIFVHPPLLFGKFPSMLAIHMAMLCLAKSLGRFKDLWGSNPPIIPRRDW